MDEAITLIAYTHRREEMRKLIAAAAALAAVATVGVLLSGAVFTPSADAAGYPGGRSCSTSYYPGYSKTYYSGYGYGG